MDQRLSFDADLIKRYDMSGPRYTSYPTAVQFHEQFGEAEYRDQAQRSNEEPIPRPLSLYVHIPFCDTVCFYCACNKVVTKDRARAAPYLNRLGQEIARQGELFDRDRRVDQLHWGGGTPTFLSQGEMSALMDELGRHFSLRTDDRGDYSIEIDPRKADPQTIGFLREIGFNRISLGVQDFDPLVQKAVNRMQTREETEAVLRAAREWDYHSVNVDLIYGLPHQSVEQFDRTLEAVIEMGPDRLSVFNYAHLPERFKPQRRISAPDLPTPATKLEILHHCIDKLGEAGYVYIGMDHFAKRNDELAIAQRQGTLHRNFQGYSTHADCDLVAMGVSAISKVADCYAQNVHALEDYYRLIDDGRLPIYRGVMLAYDDELRAEVISQLICHFELDMASIAGQFAIDFADYFKNELTELAPMQADGLLEMEGNFIRVKPAGRLLIRNICMVFDAYLRGRTAPGRFSRVI
jgi:oxygen-independent coproporphyrinogen-3 oxidase